RAVPAFDRVLSFLPFSLDDILAEVDSFAEIIRRVSDSVPTIIVPSWTAANAGRGWGTLDLSSESGISATLMRMNLRLCERLREDRRVVLLDAQRWLTGGRAGSYSPRMWYLSKTPFHQEVFQEAAG